MYKIKCFDSFIGLQCCPFRRYSDICICIEEWNISLGGSTAILMEQHALIKHKQLFEYQHLLLPKDIWWAKF